MIPEYVEISPYTFIFADWDKKVKRVGLTTNKRRQSRKKKKRMKRHHK